MTTAMSRDRRRAVLLMASLSSFLTPFMNSSVTVALPAIAQEFELNAILLSWVATSYILAAVVFLVPLGRMADLAGRKKIFRSGIILFMVAACACALAPRSGWFIFFRVLQGAGSAMIFSTSVAILVAVTPAGERGRVLGINTAAVYLGLSLGPVLGGLLTQHLGWRSIFLLNVPLGVLVLFLIKRYLVEEWKEGRGESFDSPGSLIYGASLTAIMLGFTFLPAIPGVLLIAAGVGGVVGFVFWEQRTAHPVLNISLFRGNPIFSFSNLAALINYSATFAVMFLLSLFLQHVKGYNPQLTGWILLSQPLIQALFSPLAGRLADRSQPRLVASTGMCLTAIGLFSLSFLSSSTALVLIVLNLLLLGLGFAFFSSPNTTAIMSAVEKKHLGVASATLATMRLVGQMLSMGITTLVFALVLGPREIGAGSRFFFMKSMKVAFLIFAALCGMGILASLARGKVIKNFGVDADV